MKPKIKIGHFYELKLGEKSLAAFTVLSRFEKGKNMNKYILEFHTIYGIFKNIIDKSAFDNWVKEERIKEITPEKVFVYEV